MQLQTHYEALKYFLKIVKDCAKNRKEISNLDGFIDDKLSTILKLTFNKETEYLKSISGRLQQHTDGNLRALNFLL